MSLDVQLMIRNQANETRDALSKVVGWESEIEQRDKELIELAKQGKFGYEQPKNTNRPTKKEPKKVAPKKVEIQKTTNEDTNEEKSVKQVKKSTPGRGSAPMSYEEWQKLDTKLAKDIEGDEDDKSSQGKKNSKETAEEHKEKGNGFFRAKKYDLSIREYSTAIKLDPSNPIYYHNRSIAFFHISKFSESEDDATEALRLDPRYAKAFYRRALAREALGKDMLAISDLESAQNISSDISTVNEKLVEIRIRQGISPDGTIKEVHEPKVKIINEEEPIQKPKIRVVEEPSTPEMVPMPQPKPHRMTVVEEESTSLNEPMPSSKPNKISIVSEDQTPQPGPRKVPIVTEEPIKQPTPKKVPIVSEDTSPKPSPKKIPIVTEDTKVQDQSSEQNKDYYSEALEYLHKSSAPQPTTQKPSKSIPPKQQPQFAATKTFAAWVDMLKEDYPIRLAEMNPQKLNESIGEDIEAEVIQNIIEALPLIESEKALQYCYQISQHKGFGLYKYEPSFSTAKLMVKQIIETQPDTADSNLITKCRNSWSIK